MNAPAIETSGIRIPLPPKQLLFMNETWETFPRNGAGLLAVGNRILNYRGRPLVDVGCGFGRMAYALALQGVQGKYLGIDVLKPQINWLSSNFTPVMPGYSFQHFDAINARYNPAGTKRPSDINIDRAYSSPDAIFVLSVFTHMYEADIMSYLREVSSIMDDKSIVYATFFLSNTESKALERAGGSAYPMRHSVNEHCSYFNVEDPLHAISYDEAWLRGALWDVGLYACATLYGTWPGRINALSFQDSMFLMRTS